MKIQPLIQLEGVRNFFVKDNQKQLGIDEIDIEIYPKEIVSILGPSGCGKTTILRIMADIITPEFGKVFYKNKTIREARKKGNLALVPQFFALMPNLTVLQNINLPLEIKQIKKPGKVKKLFKILKLENLENLYPAQLSGGMQQRVAIARTMVYDPKVLLMDEPFASLDEILREELNFELVKLVKSLKQTVVFVTHNVEEAVFISDRIILMKTNPGQIVNEFKIDFGERNLSLRNSAKFFHRVREVRKLIKKEGIW